MFKRTMIAASMAVAALASAQSMAAVVGGGATLPQQLYNTPGVLNSGFSAYFGVGSGGGKTAVLTNNIGSLTTTLPAGTTVDYAGSDSILSASEISTYQAAHQAPGVPATSADNWGPLLQFPSAATSVTIPYNKAGTTNLNLTSEQLCLALSSNNGAARTWGEVLGTSDTTPVRVVFRSGSSGTSEILTRHLNNRCPSVFTSVSSTFANAHPGAEPDSWIPVNGSAAVASTVASTAGAIGYVGPEDVDATNNAVVARINGLLPTVGNVQTALSTIDPPSTATDRADLTKWAPVLPNPATGYSIVGYTNFIFGQCYKDTADVTSIRTFLNKHYNATFANSNDQAIIDKKLIPLTANWKTAIRGAFIPPTSAQGVNNASVCNGIGRPA
ncbi:substrate-binding domain-containing protein [Pseudomonas chlororaphis]|uniref:substrate-binding domain-containing protein n=1 Tax=Pseudomonas chlororaphis TaxID=587753 RepID=UPI0006A6219D|nr:substrate-binding domain-containing protein [Pseudomonas chlororaphis]AZC30839.1 Phosphate-binding DING protein [Pseudomonas chlororaphis subsp. piscium]QTT89194.1 substrate-binding domain-containing protein [Pseudomonas chlororaphis]WDG78481.1 substrate-binding domain-containing protein [Pseudomonas chlororaphis]WDG88468.1 substrate-binding domain-containing protein [Pseudomonas chlororaphis]WDG94724.1 substrate-binding domain-containing protein [Pseudomonas chlororaphis]